ncbi:SMC-Scp complex subunit ScpB [Candidatus Margulisiibacteriota bacterium]
MSELKNKLETILFMAKTPLSLDDMQGLLEEDKKDIDLEINSLQEEYKQRALQIIQLAGGYQMATRPEYNKVVESYAKSPLEVALSAAAMETLAIIAYRQPISRREIENIRGVNSDAVVKALVEKRLVKELGKSELPGKPLVYGTTDYFLKHFGLNDIRDLPPEPGMKFQLPLKKESEQNVEEKIKVATEEQA